MCIFWAFNKFLPWDIISANNNESFLKVLVKVTSHDSTIRKYWAESSSQGLSQTPQLTLNTCQVGVVRPVCRWHYVSQGPALCKWARPKSHSGFPTVLHWSPARAKFLSWLSVLSFLWKMACIQKYTTYNANIHSCYLEERMANMTDGWNAARHTHTPLLIRSSLEHSCQFRLILSVSASSYGGSVG